jgi:hypothetical protein
MRLDTFNRGDYVGALAEQAKVAVAAIVGIGVTAAAKSNHSAHRTEAAVVAFADPETPVGTSTLTRHDDKITMKFRADATAPREAFTIWWVVFNNPEACSDPCGADDIFVDGNPAGELNEAQIEAADIVAAYATGKVSNPKGRVTFTASLGEHEAPGSREIIFGDEVALKDASAAEVHLVARSHGPAIPGKVDEQTGSFAGACEVFLNQPDTATENGECADELFAVHQP